MQDLEFYMKFASRYIHDSINKKNNLIEFAKYLFYEISNNNFKSVDVGDWNIEDNNHDKIFFTILNKLEKDGYVITVDWKASVEETFFHINYLLERLKIKPIQLKEVNYKYISDELFTFLNEKTMNNSGFKIDLIPVDGDCFTFGLIDNK